MADLGAVARTIGAGASNQDGKMDLATSVAGPATFCAALGRQANVKASCSDQGSHPHQASHRMNVAERGIIAATVTLPSRIGRYSVGMTS